MTIEQSSLARINQRLMSFISPDLLLAFSPAQLNKEKEITKRERALIKKIRQASQLPGQGEESLSAEVDSLDIQRLGFLIKKYEEVYRITPFDEQIVALIRSIEGYKNPKIKGKIEELKTSEGKSSVIIPIFTAYLRLQGETVQVHSVNPYLTERDYKNFLTFAKNLGIDQEVGLLDSPYNKEVLEKKIVFGL